LLDVAQAFERFKGKVVAVWSDQPKRDQKKLRELLGYDVRVYGDIFHWEKHVLEAVKAGDLKASFARELSLALLQPVAKDVVALEQRLVAKGMAAAEARAKCLDIYYLRNQSSVRKRQVSKVEALQNLEALSNKYADKDMFQATFYKAWAALKAKVAGEFYELDPSHELFINVGTADEPKWYACRGTGNAESWHHVVDKMVIANYGLELQSACYLLAINAWNHDKEVRVLKKLVLEFTADLARLNQLTQLADDLVRLKVMDEDTRANLPYADHQIVPPTDAKVVGMHAAKSETSLGKAIKLYFDDVGDESLFPRFKGRDEDVAMFDDVEARALTTTGRKLVEAMFESMLYIKPAIRKKLAQADSDSALVYSLVHENGVLESLDIPGMTLSFNGHALKAIDVCREAERDKNEQPSIDVLGISFFACDLLPTAPDFVKNHIAQVVKSRVMRKQLPQNYQAQLLPVRPAPPAHAGVDGGSLALPKPIVPDPLAVIAPPNLVGVAPQRINQAPGYGFKRSAAQAELESDTVAAPKRVHAPCPHCPEKKHCDEAHRSSCPFWLWQREPGVSQPPRNKDASGARPNKLQAWKRAYAELSRSARLSICQKYGCEQTHDEWV